jgi:hypothetical protein
MARKSSSNEVNRSQAIRDLLKTHPDIGGKEAIAKLAEQGIEVKNSLFYLVKGKMIGSKKRKKRATAKAVQIAKASAPVGSDALATIKKVKVLAAEVGGLRTLKALVEALTT